MIEYAYQYSARVGSFNSNKYIEPLYFDGILKMPFKIMDDSTFTKIKKELMAKYCRGDYVTLCIISLNYLGEIEG